MFYVGDTVWAMNFAAAAPKWLPGVLQYCLGPVSFTVGLTDRRVCRRHTDHIRARLPEENVTTTSQDRQSVFLYLRELFYLREKISQKRQRRNHHPICHRMTLQSSMMYRVQSQVKLSFRNFADRQDSCDRSLDL